MTFNDGREGLERIKILVGIALAESATDDAGAAAFLQQLTV